MARRQIEIEAKSDAPREQIYALLIDGATWPAWSPIQEFELEREGDAPPEGVGAIRVYESGRTTGRDETTELVEGRHFGYRSLSGLPVRDYRGSVDLEDDGAGTRIVWRSSFDPKVPGTGAILERGITKFLRECAEGLAAHAARQAGPAHARV
jgi:hypothetical protein